MPVCEGGPFSAAAQRLLSLACFTLALAPSFADADVRSLLESKILSPGTPQREVISFTEGRVPPMPAVKSKQQWEAIAGVLRQRVLDEVIFRGEAAGRSQIQRATHMGRYQTR